MAEQKPVHPAVKILFWSFIVTFFGGGLLVFVNNLVVRRPFLPKEAEAVIGGVVLVEFIGMVVISKCIMGVKAVRKISERVEDSSRG